MTRKILSFLMIVLVLMLAACSLVDTADENLSPFNEDLLVGFFICFDIYNESLGEYQSFPTGDFEDENALHVYYTEVDNGFYRYSMLDIKGDFFNLTTSIADGGTAANGKLGITASVVFTYELLGAILNMKGIYRKSDNSYYIEDNSADHYFGGYETTLTFEQKLNAKVTKNGKTESVFYEGKVGLTFKLIDNLVAARVLEFDSDHNLLKISVINFAGEELTEYNVLDECDYIIIEEQYEVKADNSLGHSAGDVYTTRSLITRLPQPQYHGFHIPRGNGLTRMLNLSIIF